MHTFGGFKYNMITQYTAAMFDKMAQFNPFDAIIVMQQNEQHFVVQYANNHALKLIQPTFTKGMDAEKFFQKVYWQRLYLLILQNKKEVIKIEEFNVALVIQKFEEDGQTFVAVIIRTHAKEDVQSLQVMRSAYYDELTELYNRRALKKEWANEKNFAKKGNIALLLVNIDRFKKFNESLGKQRSDYLLFEISNRFKVMRSEECEVFRHNGDEFIILQCYDDIEEVDEVAKALLQCMQQPYIVDNQEYFVSASIGIALSEAKTRNLDLLIHQADQALFYSKNNGRANYYYYSEELKHYFPNEALMEAHLHRAIELNELTIHFQPQVNLATDTIESFEALIRWNNRKFGTVSPGQFIPIAESSGLIINIGEWVIERVCQYQKEWRMLGFSPVRIAINISPIQFKQKDFVHCIARLLKKYEVDPQYLELEITESAMTNLHETTAILKRLKEIGVYVAVDDFGTGYSSLSYLKEYPLDIIKIDQSFIADIKENKKNKAIVETIILLAQNLGLEVVAEGVEEQEQERFLRENNCQKVQGYLYNRPLPADQVVAQYFL